MVGTIQKYLETYFLDFKEFFIIITIILVFIQIAQAIYISIKIEKYKHKLKKIELRFSIYNELQIIALTNIYQSLTTFHNYNNLLFHNEINYIYKNKYQNMIESWINSYIKLYDELSFNKILLSSKIKCLFSKTVTNFNLYKDLILKLREFEPIKKSISDIQSLRAEFESFFWKNKLIKNAS